MTVKGDETDEFVKGYLAKQEGKSLIRHASKPWKRGWRARQMQERLRAKFRQNWEFANAA